MRTGSVARSSAARACRSTVGVPVGPPPGRFRDDVRCPMRPGLARMSCRVPWRGSFLMTPRGVAHHAGPALERHKDGRSGVGGLTTRKRRSAMLKRFRIVGLCLVAVFAMSAVAASAASAQLPEFGRCKHEAGTYSKPNCENGAGTEYNWVPLAAGKKSNSHPNRGKVP